MRPALGRVDPLSAPYGDEPGVYNLYYLRLSRRAVGHRLNSPVAHHGKPDASPA
jgi:hypothetical protein